MHCTWLLKKQRDSCAAKTLSTGMNVKVMDFVLMQCIMMGFLRLRVHEGSNSAIVGRDWSLIWSMKRKNRWERPYIKPGRDGIGRNLWQFPARIRIHQFLGVGVSRHDHGGCEGRCRCSLYIPLYYQLALLSTGTAFFGSTELICAN